MSVERLAKYPRRGYRGFGFPWPAGAISGHEALLQGPPSRAAHRVTSKCHFLLGLRNSPRGQQSRPPPRTFPVCAPQVRLREAYQYAIYSV